MLDEAVHRRRQHEPVAYITGHKEFYGRDFIVTPDVLVPRPETEQMIEMLKNLIRQATPVTFSKGEGLGGGDTSPSPQRRGQIGIANRERGDGKKTIPQSLATLATAPFTKGSQPTNLLDLGTGSGCLAITAKSELPQLNVTAVDISGKTLTIAKQNATKLGADIKFVQSDLLSNLQGQKFDFILANLPYVDKSWPDLSPELASEPSLALYANDNGLALIKKLIIQSPEHLRDNGYLILEADRRQIPVIAAFTEQHGFAIMRHEPFTIALKYCN